MPKPKNQYGVRPRGKKFIALPYVPGVGKKWAGTWDTRAEAEAAAKRKIDDLQVLPPAQETIESFNKRWLRDSVLKASTLDRYRQDTAHFTAYVEEALGEGVKLHEIEVPFALGYARRFKHRYGSVRVFFGEARKEGFIREVPFSELGISKGPGRSHFVAITEEELHMLAAIARAEHGKFYGPMFEAIVYFAAYTTMRPGEIFGLDIGDLDLKAERIHVRRQFHKGRIQTPKYGKRKLPYIPPRAGQAIADRPRHVPKPLCSVSGGEILFPGKEGQRISSSTLGRYWHPVRSAFEARLSPERRAELRDPRLDDSPDMDFYELRHFGATLMAEKGVEPWVAAKMMGHTDGGKLFETRYSHPRESLAAERLKAAFNQPDIKPDLRAVDDEEEATG